MLIFAHKIRRNDMETSSLNKYQERVVSLMANVNEEQQMEISDLLAHYFAEKAFDEADKLWDDGIIGEQTIEEWKNSL